MMPGNWCGHLGRSGRGNTAGGQVCGGRLSVALVYLSGWKHTE